MLMAIFMRVIGFKTKKKKKEFFRMLKVINTRDISEMTKSTGME